MLAPCLPKGIGASGWPGDCLLSTSRIAVAPVKRTASALGQLLNRREWREDHNSLFQPPVRAANARPRGQTERGPAAGSGRAHPAYHARQRSAHAFNGRLHVRVSQPTIRPHELLEARYRYLLWNDQNTQGGEHLPLIGQLCAARSRVNGIVITEYTHHFAGRPVLLGEVADASAEERAIADDVDAAAVLRKGYLEWRDAGGPCGP